MTNIQTLTNEILSGSLDERLSDIYQTPERVSREKKRLTGAIAEFATLFPSDHEIEIYSAPGRSEIGGNHTDHQHGEVLAASITDDAVAVVSAVDAPEVRLLSKGYEMISLSLADLDRSSAAEGTTAALIAGVAAGMQKQGYRIGGFHAYVTSDVLSGSGLSSSAAFETIIGNIFSGLYNDGRVSAVEIAKIGQYAENVYFGKPCGLMDQMACSVGSLCHIDFADPENPLVERLSFDLQKAGFILFITDTKGSHADLTPDYAAVPAEMKSVAALFGQKVLREVSEEDVLQNVSDIRQKCGDRAFLRAVHFYEENKRVRALVAAIRENDIRTFLDNVRASGNSSFKFLQNVYTSSDTAHQNVSVALMLSEMLLGGEGACRVHGGGFAGTIQAFVKKEKGQEYRSMMEQVFGEGSCNELGIRKYGGIRII